MVRIFFFQLQQWAGLQKSLFNGGDRQGLVGAQSAGTAVKPTSMGLPSVVWSLPWLLALLDELLLALFGLLSLVSGRLLVYVVVLG